MKKITALILILGFILGTANVSIDIDSSCSISNLTMRRTRGLEPSLSLADRLSAAATSYYYKARDFFAEIFYKMCLPHSSSSSLSDAIYNIELGTPSGVKSHGTSVVLRNVNSEEYGIAQDGLSVFDGIYGKMKDSRVATLLANAEDEFQTIRTAIASQQAELEVLSGESLMLNSGLTQTEKDLLTQKAEEMGLTPERLIFVTLFAISNERNYIRDVFMDGVRQDNQEYVVFMDHMREKLEDFNPTEEVTRLLELTGYFEAAGVDSTNKAEVDSFMEWYFLSGADNPATEAEVSSAFVEGTNTLTGSYSIRDMLEAITVENVRIRDELESYGIEVNGFVEDLYREINIKILGSTEHTDEEKTNMLNSFNRSIANIDRWRTKLAETGSDDIKDELVEIAKARAEQEGISNARLQEYINDFIYQEVSLGEETGQLLYVVQGLVRWSLQYEFSDGDALRQKLDNLMDPEVARRATRLAMFIIFDCGARDYLGNPISVTPIDSAEEVEAAPAEEVEADAIVAAIVNPLEMVNRFSMECVHTALSAMARIASIQPGQEVSYDLIAFMIKISAEANIVDFNTPDMVALRTSQYEAVNTITERLETGGDRTLSVNMGGEYELREFYENYISSGEDVTISISPDNNGQGMVTLKLADTLLLANPNLDVFFIPKNGQHTNDLSCADTLAYVQYDINSDKPLLTVLAGSLGVMDKDGNIYRMNIEEQDGKKVLVRSDSSISGAEERPRFVVLEDGPQVQGLSPSTASRTVIEAINNSDAIITEGQAFAEIRGWNIPVYLSFMIKGRAAMALHGENKAMKLTVFGGYPAGSIHYYDVEAQMGTYYQDPVTGESIGVAGMTTRDFMEVLASNEWLDFVGTSFSGDEVQATRHITTRALAENRSFKDVVLEEAGVSSLTITLPEFLLDQYTAPADRSHYSNLAELVGAISVLSDATLLQQRCVWEAAASLGLQLPDNHMVLDHWVEANVRSTQACSEHESEKAIPKSFSHEIQFLSRILKISNIILEGVESGKTELEIVTDVINGGSGDIYSLMLDRLIVNGAFVSQIGGLIP